LQDSFSQRIIHARDFLREGIGPTEEPADRFGGIRLARELDGHSYAFIAWGLEIGDIQNCRRFAPAETIGRKPGSLEGNKPTLLAGGARGVQAEAPR
jgi:hypothetical protein